MIVPGPLSAPFVPGEELRPEPAASATTPPRLYLAGYGNAIPERFFEHMRSCAVDLALDARIFPRGWSPAYCGRAFLGHLVAEGGAARAQHAPGLGNAAKRDGGEMRLADGASLDKLVQRLQTGSVVMVICGCRDGARCHRTLIARLASEQLPELEIIEIGPPPKPLAQPTPDPGEAA
jgi:hypothetical protein